MPAVIADTGPLNYLILIGYADVLGTLFETVLVPEAVRRELTQLGAPVRALIAAPPAWFAVQSDTENRDADLQRLGAGERAAVLLAVARHADLMLMDDRAGAVAARARGLTTVGALGLIDHAARRGLLDLETAITGLRTTNFRCRPEMLDDLRIQHRQL